MNIADSPRLLNLRPFGAVLYSFETIQEFIQHQSLARIQTGNGMFFSEAGFLQYTGQS
ncbi:hypothetical protein [Flavihumibacter cheonanensis]|uniref:hypothetical protein n=1 Tax=Flavihumibacter cheonanensis TaxID=1442385 RepID=UPI001EF99049|nr:hypothetical protein [Flavihumibacter cheonanensis]MCG7752892.1 hypothetical protein [Flavihumibacter cheonanensis]